LGGLAVTYDKELATAKLNDVRSCILTNPPKKIRTRMKKNLLLLYSFPITFLRFSPQPALNWFFLIKNTILPINISKLDHRLSGWNEIDWDYARKYRFARAVKHKALALTAKGKKQSEVAASLDISGRTIWWARLKLRRHGDIEGGQQKVGPIPTEIVF
jgi:hypothetical protein